MNGRGKTDKLWATRIMDGIPDIENVTAALQPDGSGGGRWGRCVYHSENDVNDQQVSSERNKVALNGADECMSCVGRQYTVRRWFYSQLHHGESPNLLSHHVKR